MKRRDETGGLIESCTRYWIKFSATPGYAAHLKTRCRFNPWYFPKYRPWLILLLSINELVTVGAEETDSIYVQVRGCRESSRMEWKYVIQTDTQLLLCNVCSLSQHHSCYYVLCRIVGSLLSLDVFEHADINPNQLLLSARINSNKVHSNQSVTGPKAPIPDRGLHICWL